MVPVAGDPIQPQHRLPVPPNATTSPPLAVIPTREPNPSLGEQFSTPLTWSTQAIRSSLKTALTSRRCFLLPMALSALLWYSSQRTNGELGLRLRIHPVTLIIPSTSEVITQLSRTSI